MVRTKMAVWWLLRRWATVEWSAVFEIISPKKKGFAVQERVKYPVYWRERSCGTIVFVAESWCAIRARIFNRASEHTYLPSELKTRMVEMRLVKSATKI